MQILDFNFSEALNGGSIGFVSGQSLVQYIINFKKTTYIDYHKQYSGVGQKDNITYYFNEKGQCDDNSSEHLLYKIKEESDYTVGTAVTRGDGSSKETINIDILQPREQFALSAMQGILSKIDNPLSLDEGNISIISEVAFKIAQNMLNVAAKYRAATIEDGGATTPVDIDINNVTSTTDKILFNMSHSILNMQNDIEEIKDTMISEKDKVQKVDINKVSVSEVPVYVTNMISEPVNITGTVSVDNFPSTTE